MSNTNQNFSGTNQDAAIFLNILLVAVSILGFFYAVPADGFRALTTYGALASLLTAVSSFCYMMAEGATRRRIHALEYEMQKNREERRADQARDRQKINAVGEHAASRYRAVRVIRYLSVTMTTLTLFTSLFILLPLSGGKAGEVLWSGGMKYFHIFVPVLSLLSFIFLEPGKPFSKKAALLSLIPTGIYGLILLVLNAAGAVEGPYPFLLVHAQPVYMTLVWILVILAANFALSLLISALNHRLAES